jgi:DnaK suppressor protein
VIFRPCVLPLRHAAHLGVAALTLDLESYRTRLREEERELRDASERSAAERAPVQLDQQSVGRLSRMDALQVQAMAKAEQERRRTRLRRVEMALGRIELGDFAYCAQCEEDIEAKRLDADPTVPLCIKCAQSG